MGIIIMVLVNCLLVAAGYFWFSDESITKCKKCSIIKISEKIVRNKNV
ncbi:hypothetical protein M0R19_03680 [Candidatus Pacearchaeota archaeon]|nr:hypothetical protein [Candidatus Pacearchaeota archaeon]